MAARTLCQWRTILAAPIVLIQQDAARKTICELKLQVAQASAASAKKQSG